MTRHARKVDGNHAAIRDGLRRVPGVYVQDVAAAPGLGFDLIARYQDGPPLFLEIKNGSPLTDSEKRARARYGQYWHAVTTFDEALFVLGIDTKPAPF